MKSDMSITSPAWKDKHLAGQVYPDNSVAPTVTESVETPVFLYQKADSSGKTICSMSLGADAYGLISVAITVIVFVKIIRFVIGD